MIPLNGYILVESIKEKKEGFITTVDENRLEFVRVVASGDCDFLDDGDEVAAKSYDIIEVEGHKFIQSSEILGKCEK